MTDRPTLCDGCERDVQCLDPHPLCKHRIAYWDAGYARAMSRAAELARDFAALRSEVAWRGLMALARELDSLAGAPPSTPPEPPPGMDVLEAALVVAVGGDWLEGSIAEHARACTVLIAEEQERPNPNNAVIGVLCNSVRLAREHVRMATEKLALPTGAPPSKPTADGEARRLLAELVAAHDACMATDNLDAYNIAEQRHDKAHDAALASERERARREEGTLRTGLQLVFDLPSTATDEDIVQAAARARNAELKGGDTMARSAVESARECNDYCPCACHAAREGYDAGHLAGMQNRDPTTARRLLRELCDALSRKHTAKTGDGYATACLDTDALLNAARSFLSGSAEPPGRTAPPNRDVCWKCGADASNTTCQRCLSCCTEKERHQIAAGERPHGREGGET